MKTGREQEHASRNDMDPRVLQQAAEWWIRLREPHGIEVTSEWMEWCAVADHALAFEQVTELGARLGALTHVEKRALVDEFGGQKVKEDKAIVFPRWPRLARVAALMALALGAGYGLLVYEPASRQGQLFVSQVGENRNILLDDGSQVDLGGASTLSERFSIRRRDVVLRRGEAYFQVAHNNRRPFIVEAGKVTVRAVGTAFNIHREGERVTVAVSEGVVGIADKGARPQALTVEARAGQQVVFDPAVSGLVVSEIDPAKLGTWRSHRLEYADMPLASVIADINRYSRHPLVLDDAALGARAFTGTVSLDHLDGWVAALPYILPVNIERQPQRVVISARH